MVCPRFCFLEDFSVILTNNFLSVEYYFYNWTENKLIFRFLETHYSVFKLFLCTKDMVYHSAYNTNDVLITLNHSLRNYHKFLKKWFNNTDNSVWVMNNEITNVFHTKRMCLHFPYILLRQHPHCYLFMTHWLLPVFRKIETP